MARSRRPASPRSRRAFSAYGLVAGLLGLAIAAAGCGRAETPRFVRLAPEQTGITFVNALAPDADFNFLNYLYYYDGGGVAVGDVNNDGWVDLYFTANEGPNRLYLNRGGMRFEDVTEHAGVAGSGDWTTGVSMADVNGDGWLDIYVSNVGGYLGREGRNQLFINHGDGTFTDRAAEYGLDFQGLSTQGLFFDYDGDGDLDLFLLTHAVHTDETHGPSTLRLKRDPAAGDRLYRNDSDDAGIRFTDVSEAAGIYGSLIGYGLGVVASDFDGNGCPDLYVANDFHENDYLYVNNCDGTFTERIEAATGHTSLSSMGVDAADVNNDGRPDVVVLDMLPDRPDVWSTAVSVEDYAVYRIKRRHGYQPQFTRNTLQLNRGGGRFSEIGFLAGIEATDWSWAPLLCDLDADGFNDLFVTNGIYRRPNDLDYVRHVGTPSVQASMARGIRPEHLRLVERMPQVRIPNYAFRNNGDLTFTNRAAEWGLDDTAFAGAAAYADLDNDGDLDLVVNNLEEPAAVFENRTDRLPGHRYLTVVLEGSGANTAGIGATVVLHHGGRVQVREQFPVRGFQSSVDPRLHFGLGDAESVDSLRVIWPDGRSQLLVAVAARQTITLRQADASAGYASVRPMASVPLFEDVTDAAALNYRHQEDPFNELERSPLLPHRLSTEGPALAVGDVNGDGLDDFFAGGASRQPAKLFVQERDGRFRTASDATWRADALHEDVDAVFFDADADGDLDLYVASGGMARDGDAVLQDRLYLNDGTGTFTRAAGALPGRLASNSAVVRPADFDGDGDVDLFVGSRAVGRVYGRIPPSYLLVNDGTGTFTDATASLAPALSQAGMVTDAAWTDFDGDGVLDLVVVGEWMPVRVFRQEEGRFVERTDAAGLAETYGWWSAVLARDVDADGDVDLVLGNLGLNAGVRARPEAPARLYVHDFDGDGRIDPLLTSYRHGASRPVATPEMLLAQLPSLRAQYPTFASFGEARVDDLFSRAQLTEADVREVHTFASMYAANDGQGTFTLHPLPAEAQFAPVRAVVFEDFDRDGRPDLLLGGNFFGGSLALGRLDASYGVLLRSGEDGGWTAVDAEQANLWMTGDVRKVALLGRPDGSVWLVVARNDDRLQLIRTRLGAPALAASP